MTQVEFAQERVTAAVQDKAKLVKANKQAVDELKASHLPGLKAASKAIAQTLRDMAFASRATAKAQAQAASDDSTGDDEAGPIDDDDGSDEVECTHEKQLMGRCVGCGANMDDA